MGRLKLSLFLGSCLALAGCVSAEKQRLIVTPPAATAFAPQAAPAEPPKPVPTTPEAPPAAVTSATPAAASIPSDPVDALLKQVQAVYQAGVADYQAGNLEKAKEEFDQAVAAMLESKLDVQGNERLSSQFDSMVEDIYDMELAALERGDTLSAHTYQPPPIESFAGLTFPVDPNVKARAQEELKSVHSDLPLVSNDLVDGVLTFLQKHGRTYIETVLKGRARYGPMIEQVLRRQGLPQDLIYLAAGESGFNPHALSRKGAKGIWQFMPGTGELYGLRRNRWVDEREDPVKSTEAAAKHLKDLYRTFGDWFLAMAAYDWGPDGIQKAIERTGYADYWKLRELHALPSETENYVPIFLATALIAKDPQAYGFSLPADPPLEVDRVTVSVPTDLRLIADLIGQPVEELIQLNPSLLTWSTPANEPDFTLNLPAGTKDTYERLIAEVPENHRMWWRAYKVREGETLAAVARKFHISTVSLEQANRIEKGDPVDDGALLVVPLAPGRESSIQRVHMVLRRHYYRVRRGDTLQLIADRYDTTPYEIRRWNHLRSSHLTAGKSLLVYAAVPSQSTRRRVTHRHRRHASAKTKVASVAHRKPEKKKHHAAGAGLEASR